MSERARPATARGKRREPRFYGWTIVWVMVVFSAVTVGMAGPNLGVFIRPMQADLHWSAGIFGWSQLARMAAALLAGPAIGRVLDRYGPRTLLASTGLVMGFIVAAMAFMTAEWHLIVLFTLSGLIGMGRASDMYVGATVAKWFVRRRGEAMGIAMAGVPIGIIAVYPLSQWLVDHVGWRTAWVIFGLGGAAIIVPPALVWLRRQPEDMGLLADGATLAGDVPSRPGVGAWAEEHSWTREAAMRHRTFWLMVVGWSLFNFSFAAVTVFRVPHYAERGLSTTVVSWAVPVDAAVAIAASLMMGPVLARGVPSRVMAGVGMGAMSVCAALLIVVDNNWLLFTSTVFWGFGIQVGLVAQGVMWAEYWGRAHQGAIRGLTLPLTTGIGALAYPMTGVIRDQAGTYTPAWIIAIGGFAIATAVLLPLRRPAKRESALA